MNQQEKKEYILKNWKISSGKKITEMLKRYWNDDLIETAKKIFNVKGEN